MNKIHCIAVGTDFSEPAEQALDEALDLAKLVGASIILVHAYEIPMLSLPDAVVPLARETVNAIAEAGLKGLAASAERTKDRGVPMRTVLRLGPPWDELNAVAIEEGAEMIVVGTHGKTGFSRALLGSVAERTTRTATRPVLVVHAVRSSGEHGSKR